MRVRVHCCVSLAKTKLSCFRGSAPSAARCCAEVWSPLAAGCAEAAAASGGGGGGGGSWRTGLGLMEHTGQHKVGDHSQGVRRYQPTACFVCVLVPVWDLLSRTLSLCEALKSPNSA